ncbi:mechanosensitive ion channel family protein [Myxococcota bacterium]
MTCPSGPRYRFWASWWGKLTRHCSGQAVHRVGAGESETDPSIGAVPKRRIEIAVVGRAVVGRAVVGRAVVGPPQKQKQRRYSIEAFWTKLESTFSVSALAQQLVVWLPSVVSAVAVLLLFYALWLVARSGAAVVIRRSRLDETAGSFIQTIIQYVLLTLGVVSALGKVGVNTASLLTSLGVAGLTIGFAAKDALSNMISGLFIFWDRPFVIGDLVEIGGAYGRVADITMRSTRVVTPDGRMLAIPNTIIVNTTVASYTNFPHLRLDTAFTVAVTEDLGHVRETALKVAQQHPGLMQEPPPAVVVTALNDYNVTLELQVWLEDEKQHVASRHALRETLFEALRAEGVDMPYETFALAPLEVKGPVSGISG